MIIDMLDSSLAQQTMLLAFCAEGFCTSVLFIYSWCLAAHALSLTHKLVVFISGESGLVYKGYLDTPLGKELVAVKTGKG